MDTTLPPIPTPPAQRWREFRIQILPLVIFGLLLIVVALMWRNFVQPSGVIGEVEAVKANVISLSDGQIVELTVDRFSEVVKDQPIGVLVGTDPAVLEASLTAIAADLKLMQSRMDLDRTRNLDSYSRLRMGLLEEQVALDIARVRLKQAEADFQRMSKLYDQKIIGAGVPLTAANLTGRDDFGLEVSQRDRDALQFEVEDRTKLVAQLEQDLKRMDTLGVDHFEPRDPVVEEAIRAQQEKLRLTDKPTILKAPIDGVVSLVYKRAGEKVIKGEPILTISVPTSDRIVGYLRQPLGTLPTTNDSVVVRTRSYKRQIGVGQILRVGAQMELINPVLISTDNTRTELGLPVLISLPAGLRLVPGESVDLSIQFAKR